MSRTLTDWRDKPITPGATVLYRSASKNQVTWKLGEVLAVRLDGWGGTVLDIDWRESSGDIVNSKGSGISVENVMVWEGA